MCEEVNFYELFFLMYDISFSCEHNPQLIIYSIWLQDIVSCHKFIALPKVQQNIKKSLFHSTAMGGMPRLRGINMTLSDIMLSITTISGIFYFHGQNEKNSTKIRYMDILLGSIITNFANYQKLLVLKQPRQKCLTTIINLFGHLGNLCGDF